MWKSSSLQFTKWKSSPTWLIVNNEVYINMQLAAEFLAIYNFEIWDLYNAARKLIWYEIGETRSGSQKGKRVNISGYGYLLCEGFRQYKYEIFLDIWRTYTLKYEHLWNHCSFNSKCETLRNHHDHCSRLFQYTWMYRKNHVLNLNKYLIPIGWWVNFRSTDLAPQKKGVQQQLLQIYPQHFYHDNKDERFDAQHKGISAF